MTCRGCEKAEDPLQSVNLPNGWSVGHYGGPEGFFGWLALQTVAHRKTLTELSAAEAAALGETLQRLERGIYGYWNGIGCRVARVYIMYFLEGQLECGPEWHLHMHLVPRFDSLGTSMRDKTDILGKCVGGIDAYLIGKLRGGHDTYNLPVDFDRSGEAESTRRARELGIVTGVVAAAGFPGGLGPHPKPVST